MGSFRLRTKFLLSLVAITAGLSTATLLTVRYSVQKRVRAGIQEDLRNSVETYGTFEHQRQETLSRSAELLANLPNVRALMTTGDSPTIQDGSAEVWRQSGSDLLIMANRSGQVLGLQSRSAGLNREMAQQFLARSLSQQESKDWWFGAGRLYQILLQPIYFGAASANSTTGFLVVGHEIGAEDARNFGNITAGEVAFYADSTLVATTLPDSEKSQLEEQFQASESSQDEIKLGSERYLRASVELSANGHPAVSLSILKSFDKATQFLNELNRVLIGLGLISVLAGACLVFLISHTFTRPLANLVASVRALEQGDFEYPLDATGGDEVAEVTGAFDRMRTSLKKTQEDQKQLENRLRQAHKMEAVGRLAGGVAHDFNNLLTIIRGHADLLFDRISGTESNRNSVEQIQKAAGRAVTMTRQLLAFSRMQVLQPRVLDLNAVVADMGKMLPRLIGEHIEYAFTPDPKLSAVQADPGQIEQVILNLVVNSRDAMPNGGKILVTTANVDMDEREAAKRPPMAPGPYVLLSVADTGHGMDEKTKAHIFEPFFTTKEMGKGTGLGLATVYGVVKQSGGFIWVESEVGKGTRFDIYLPLVAAKVPAAGTENKPVAVPRGSETILVVEDESGVRALTREFLKVSGYAVLEAKDGFEALEEASKYTGKIHLLLTDMVMPRMSGSELAARMKAARPDTKILYMTGYAEYMAGGASAAQQFPILQKPFSVSSLVENIRAVLADKELEQRSDADVHVS
ncbi:MAG TPA: ATP-binding protein [Candidatus Acidoferrales bacterium]|jgi:signal transduction histidine kinase/ActR/RegA family two-component response regulator|nr:ATP-binding protein [Candidatus Acidoferrales bacterium]